MRILLVSNYQPPHMGGIEFACQALKRWWTHHGHQVTWLTTDLPPGGAPATPDNVRLPACNLLEDLWEINSPLVPPWWWPRVRRLILAHDVVNIHSLAPGLSSLALRFAVALRRPTVVTQHVGIIPLRWRWLTALQYRIIRRKARWVDRQGIPLTFVGEAVRRWFVQHAGIPEEHTCMTPAGINHDEFHFVTDEEKRRLRRKWDLPETSLAVLFVGRFYRKKGMDILRESAAACREIAFTFRGSGPDDPRNWGLSNVRVVGLLSTAELRELYGAHDLLVLPSVGEGWPAVIPQAMACGTPCLISEETFRGYGRDPHMFIICTRSPEVICTHLRSAAAGRLPLLQRRREIAEYSRAHWNWEATARIYEDLFRRRIDDIGSPSPSVPATGAHTAE